MGCLGNGVVRSEALQPPNFCQQPLCQATAIGLNELNIMAEKRARGQQLNRSHDGELLVQLPATAEENDRVHLAHLIGNKYGT